MPYPTKTIRKYYKYEETPWTQPILTQNGTMGGSEYACTASNENSSHRAFHAFDNDNSSYWDSGDGLKYGWLLFYSPVGIKVSNIYLDFYGLYYYCGNGQIQGSNDNFTWEDIGSFDGNTNKTVNITCESIQYYNYIRISLSNSKVNGCILSTVNITATQGTITEGTPEDYDFYEDVVEPVPMRCKKVTETTRYYYKYKSPAEGYRELTKLSASGDQHININYVAGNNTGVEIKFKYYQVASREDNASATIIGCRQNYQSRQFQISTWTGGCFAYGTAGHTSNYPNINTEYVVKYNTDGNHNLYVNDVFKGNYTAGTFTTPYSLLLFAMIDQGNVNEHLVGEISYCKLYESGVASGDIVAVERLSDNAIGVYNKTGGTFHPNAGSGSFTAGDYIVEEGTQDDYDFYEDITESTYSLPKTTEIIRHYYKYSDIPNVIVNGSPTITNGVVSNFSSTNYLTSETDLVQAMSQANNWELVLRFKANLNSDYNTILANGNLNSSQSIAYGIYIYAPNNSGKVNVNISHTGSVGASTAIIFTSDTLTNNTVYDLKITFNGSSFKAYLSSDLKDADDETKSWTQFGSQNETRKIKYGSEYPTKFGCQYSGSYPMSGNVDFNHCYLKTDNKLSWLGTKILEGTEDDYDFYEDKTKITYYGLLDL